MNKTVVIYRSVYGYTKTYAEMIAEELTCDLRESSEISPDDLLSYDTIIYGGGLYAIGINGINLLKKNYELADTAAKFGQNATTLLVLKRRKGAK